MRYLITLKPLEPFLFGGNTTFGKLGDKTEGSYIVQSKYFPQQTALLGMMQKEIMIQAGLLTRKRRGEWANDASSVLQLIGTGKFNIDDPDSIKPQAIQRIEPIFLRQGESYYIKKAKIDTYQYDARNEILTNYSPKKDFFDNYICVQTGDCVSAQDIFRPVVQAGNKKGGADNSLFKKTSYVFKENFVFSFFMETTFELEESIVHLGADRGSFKMTPQVVEQNNKLEYVDPNGYLVLLSDSYVETPLSECCKFAMTSEIGFSHLLGKKNTLSKSETYYFYEKGSVFIEPKDTLIKQLDRPHLQYLGYNIYTQGEKR